MLIRESKMCRKEEGPNQDGRSRTWEGRIDGSTWGETGESEIERKREGGVSSEMRIPGENAALSNQAPTMIQNRTGIELLTSERRFVTGYGALGGRS